MANEQNLRPSEYKFTQEEHKKGGIASGKARRERKKMREQLEMLLELPVKDKKAREKIRKQLGIKNEDIDNQMLATVALFQKAIKGDTKAYELIRNTIGEEPSKKLEIEKAPVINLNRPKKE